MNIAGIEINAQNVALAFTILFLIFVLLNGFVGFLRGSKKSIFYLIVSVVVFGLGFGLMTLIIGGLLKLPIGAWVGGLVSSMYPEVTATSTAEDIILGIIINQFPQLAGAVSEGSATASFVMGLVSFVIKLVYILLILILAFTLFKLIADIIWLIIRPKKKDGVRPKKTFGGRMVGFGIGSVKGAIYSLLIFTLIAGIASVGTSALAVAQSASSDNTEAVLVLTDKNATLITLDASEGNSSSSLFGDMDLEFLASVVGAYRKSVPGAMFGAVKISTVPFDEFVFDGVFSFDVQVGDEKIKVKLRQEVETVANAVAKVASEFDIQDVTLEKLLSLDEEGEEALKGLVDAISDLSILKVAIPVALEVGLYSDILVDENGDKLLGNFFTPDQIPELSTAILNDIKSIGYTVVDARAVISVFVGEGEKDINTFLNLNPEVVQLLFDEDHLGGLDTVDILAPIGLTYLTTIESVKQALDDFGLSIEELTNMPEGATWGQEISKLGDVYIALQDLLKDPETGRVFIDKDNYTAILDLFTEEKINNFVDVLFTSNLVNNSAGALVTFAKDKLLPEDYQQFITIGDDVKFDANECKAFLNAASCLVQSGFLSMMGGEGIDLGELFNNLNVDDLAKYLSQSTIVRASLANSLDLLLSNLSTGDVGLRFGEFDDWDDQAYTEIELRNVLRAMKILGKNLLNEDGENQGFSINTLRSLKDEELEVILTSHIMSGTIVNFLVDNSGDGQTLEIIGEGVKKVNAKPDDWHDQYYLEENATLDGNNLVITPASKELDEEYLIDHFLIYCNGTYLTSVRTKAGEGATVDFTTKSIGKDSSGKKTYHIPSSENTYKAYGVNIMRMGVERYSIEGNILTINPAHLELDNDKNGVDRFNIYADGELIYSQSVNQSRVVSVDLSQIKVGVDENDNDVFFTLKEDTKIEVYGYRAGELRLLFINVFKLFAGIDDLNMDNSMIAALIKNLAGLTNNLGAIDDGVGEIITSVVLNETLISFLKTLPEKTSGVIKIDNPNDIKWNDEGNNEGEVRKLLRSISILLVDDGGNVLYDQLLSDDLNTKLGVFFDLDDEEIDKALESIVITDTIKGIILDYSEGSEAFLYLRDRDKTEEEWSACLAQFVKSARILLKSEDEEGNTVYSLNVLQGGDTNLFIDLLLGMSDDDIENLTKSDIIVDTIADKIITYADATGSVLAVPARLKTNWTTSAWEDETKKLIKSLDLILQGDAGKMDKLGENADELISMITGLIDEENPENDKLAEALESDVMSATMAKQILSFGETLDVHNVTTYDVDNDLTDWRCEEERLIRSAKLVLADENGKIQINNLGQDTNKLFEYVVNLSDEELDKVLDSVIFTDTIAKNIRSFGEGPEATLVVTGAASYETPEWKLEIEYIVHSVKVLIATKNLETNKYTVNINALNNSEEINNMFNKIVSLTSDIEVEENDKLGETLRSVVISDTFIKQIKSNSATLTINDEAVGFSWYDDKLYTIEAKAGELRKLIVAMHDLFKGSNINITGLDANLIINKLRLLTNKIGEEDDEVGPLFESLVLKDTMVNQICDLDKPGDSKIVVPYEVDDYRWVDYEDAGLQSGELRLILKSLAALYPGEGECDFGNISSSLTVDDLTDKTKITDERIHNLFASLIVRLTGSREVVGTLTGPSLVEYIELDKDYDGNAITENVDEARREMVAEDLENLVFSLRSLKDAGVNYNAFNYDNFNAAYKANGNDVPDALQRSKLVIHSLDKMMTKLLDSSTTDDYIKGAINTELADDDWRTYDGASKQPFEVDYNEGTATNGELRKLFEVMDELQKFQGATFDINDGSNASVLKKINHSLVTHNVIPTVIDRSLTSINQWKYGTDDRRELTADEWDNEIDIFCDVLAMDINMNGLTIVGDGVNAAFIAKLNKIIKLMALSRYLDVSVLATKVKSGIETQFSAGAITIHVHDDVYNYTPLGELENPSSYDEKIATWNGNDTTIELINASTALDPLEGEVDNVMDAIEQLQDISYTDVTNIVAYKVAGVPMLYGAAQTSGEKLGNFLDRCAVTRMLEDVPSDIFTAANTALSTAGCGTINYVKQGVPTEHYCKDLFSDYIG